MKVIFIFQLFSETDSHIGLELFYISDSYFQKLTVILGWNHFIFQLFSKTDSHIGLEYIILAK